MAARRRMAAARSPARTPTKVDRSAAYAARYLAKNVVAAELADRCTIQLAYAIGVAQPLSVYVDLHGTGKVDEAKLEKALREVMDLSPSGIRRHSRPQQADLRQARQSYGHFGRKAWPRRFFLLGKTDLAKALKDAVAGLTRRLSADQPMDPKAAPNGRVDRSLLRPPARQDHLGPQAGALRSKAASARTGSTSTVPNRRPICATLFEARCRRRCGSRSASAAASICCTAPLEAPTIGFIGVEPFVNGMAKMMMAAAAKRRLPICQVYDDDATRVARLAAAGLARRRSTFSILIRGRRRALEAALRQPGQSRPFRARAEAGRQLPLRLRHRHLCELDLAALPGARRIRMAVRRQRTTGTKPYRWLAGHALRGEGAFARAGGPPILPSSGSKSRAAWRAGGAWSARQIFRNGRSC